jgi:hypothetical protein
VLGPCTVRRKYAPLVNRLKESCCAGSGLHKWGLSGVGEHLDGGVHWLAEDASGSPQAMRRYSAWLSGLSSSCHNPRHKRVSYCKVAMANSRRCSELAPKSQASMRESNCLRTARLPKGSSGGRPPGQVRQRIWVRPARSPTDYTQHVHISAVPGLRSRALSGSSGTCCNGHCVGRAILD